MKKDFFSSYCTIVTAVQNVLPYVLNFRNESLKFEGIIHQLLVHYHLKLQLSCLEGIIFVPNLFKCLGEFVLEFAELSILVSEKVVFACAK